MVMCAAPPSSKHAMGWVGQLVVSLPELHQRSDEMLDVAFSKLSGTTRAARKQRCNMK